MREILFTITVDKTQMMAMVFFVLILSLFSVGFFLFLSFRCYLDYKRAIRMLFDYIDKTKSNIKKIEKENKEIIKSINDEWGQQKNVFEQQEFKSKAIFNQLKSVADAYRVMRINMIKDVEKKEGENCG